MAVAPAFANTRAAHAMRFEIAAPRVHVLAGQLAELGERGAKQLVLGIDDGIRADTW